MSTQETSFERYLKQNNYSPFSIRIMHATVQRFAVWADAERVELHKVRYNDVLFYMDYCQKRGNNPRTIQLAIQSLRHYYDFLLKEGLEGLGELEGLIRENPCHSIEVKGIKRKTLYELFTMEELETIYQNFVANVPYSALHYVNHHRNRVMLSLLVYQGLQSGELCRLTTKDIRLREGKIYVAGSCRSNRRELKLEAHQLYDLMDYIDQSRPELLRLSGKESDALFISACPGQNRYSIYSLLIKRLQNQDQRIKSLRQLRASVLTNWLKVYDVRKVQYLAGHRYVSSTESYQAGNMDQLIEEVNKYHPDV